NKPPMANPYQTVYSFTEDGNSWHEVKNVPDLDGWLFWRPKTNDNITFYTAAYWHEHGASILLKTTNGINWTKVSDIHKGDGNDETAIEFLPDGRLITTARLEITPDNGIGNTDAGTLIAVSEYPYNSWENATVSHLTRLDGPCLFKLNSRIFAVGRFQPEKDMLLTQLGGILSKKRTSIFSLDENKLNWLTDLPSAGDTSYAGVVVKNGSVYISYYTSDVSHDYPWFLGMFLGSPIKMARIDVSTLLSSSTSPPNPPNELPLAAYIILFSNIAASSTIIVILVKKGYLPISKMNTRKTRGIAKKK
ncbi:MAG: hypothetical protein ACTSXP_10610, partial [Promethearchaeota archaeon]